MYFFWLVALCLGLVDWLIVGFVLRGFVGSCFYFGLVSLCLGGFVCC